MSLASLPARGRRSVILVACLASLAAVAGLAQPADAAQCTRVASPTGSDADPGTEASPFKTVQALANALAPGDIGCLRAGVYDDVLSRYVLRFPQAGTASAPITIRSYPGERATLRGIVLVPAGSDHVALTDVDVEGDGTANTIKIYAADTVIERDDITNRNLGRSCMILGSSDGGRAVRPVVRRNRFEACGSPLNGNKDHDIYAANLVDGQITDNLLLTPAAYAIQLYPNAQRTLVAHNVIDGTRSIRGGIVIAGNPTSASSDNVIEQNVVAHPATHGVSSSWDGPVGTGNVVRSNCIWDSGYDPISSPDGFTASENVVADPLFLDPPRDYRLAPESSCLGVVGYDTVARMEGAPTVTLLAPADGSTFTRTLELSADASDDVKVLKVEFYVDGALVATETGAPYHQYWSGANLTYGKHQVIAKAYDNAGLTSRTVAATITRVP